jgi:hypothetical protein
VDVHLVLVDQVPLAHIYRRLKVHKLRDNTGNNEFRLPLLLTSPNSQLRFPTQQLPGKVHLTDVVTSVGGREECRWQVSWDFQTVPAGDFADLIVEELSTGQYLEGGAAATSISFQVPVETAELTAWILMPRGKEYGSFQITRREAGKASKTERWRPVTEYLAEDYTILAFKLLALKPGWVYEVRWVYK